MSKEIKANDEMMFRHIHPNFVKNGEPSSDRFRPSDSDKNKMSVDRGALTTPSQSHATYTCTGRKSAAVYGIQVDEFSLEGVSCYEDPINEGDNKNPAHALADYGAHDKNKQKIISKKLHRIACKRGALYVHTNKDEDK